MIDVERYVRTGRLPFIWCAGCGNGIVLKAILAALARLKVSQDELVMVSGIGCSSRATGYVDSCTLHTTHGRAIAFATGVKMARPDLTVVVVTGDGDATAIGGNHFIHAARRNIDLTVVLFNNWIYGMTGGQVSPTTPRGSWATTAPHGNPEGSFDISRLAVAAGAVFVARAAVSQPVKLSRYIEKGIRKKGFALIEALTPCPTSYGRRNRLGRPVDHLLWLRDHVVDAGRKASAEEEERQGDAAEPRLVTGIFADCERPEYTARYRDLVESLAGEDPGPPLPEREVVTAWAEREEEHRP